MDKVKTNVQNAKWHTLWQKRMAKNKPREGDYNFVVWKNGSEIIVEPWDKSMPPSIYTKGLWVQLAKDYREDKYTNEEN
jgi:hypothetical protein